MPGTRKPRRRRAAPRHPSVTRGTSQARPSRGTPPAARRFGLRPRTRRKIRRWLFYVGALVFAIAVIAGFALGDFFNALPQGGTGATNYKDGVGVPQLLLPTAQHLNGLDVNYHPDQKTTTLESASDQGVTQVIVAQAGLILSDDSITIDTGQKQETRLATSVDGTTITLDSPLNQAHDAGVEVVRLSEFSTPPSSGNHWSTAGAPITCGFYENPVRDEVVVHNMEHGHVIMSYNLTDPQDIERLREVHDNLIGSDQWLVTRFYPGINEGEVAMTAWGVLDRFSGIDEARIKAFLEAYRGNRFSPETRSLGRGIPCT